MGAWDHFYPDSAFDRNASTHYVNLPHWLQISHDEVSKLQLPQGPDEQHASWRWLGLNEAAIDPSVHPYVQIYAQWVATRRI